MASFKEFYFKLSVFFNRVTMAQKLFLVQNLSVMIRAGVPLVGALTAVAQQTEAPRLKITLLSIKSNIEKGNPFYQSLEAYPRIFNNLFISMIKAGESSGKLEESLVQLYEQMKKTYDMLRKVRSALIYPVIVVVAMIGIGIAMMIYVIPNISQIFKEVNATLPIFTRALIAISDFTVNNGLLVSLGIATIVAGIWFLMKVRQVRYYWQLLLLNLPVFKMIIKKVNIARFARTLGSLLNTEVPIASAMEITGDVLNNLHYKKALAASRESIKKGVSIEETLRQYRSLFPPVVTQMIAIGEKSGSLDKVLSEMANYYEEEVNQIMNDLPSILEPILIMVLGAGVASMAIAIIMPMYSLAEQM